MAHLCTVGDEKIDPVEAMGIRPDKPLPYWGWETSLTSTAAAGTATAANHLCHPTLCWPISRLCGRCGARRLTTEATARLPLGTPEEKTFSASRQQHGTAERLDGPVANTLSKSAPSRAVA